VAISGSSLVRSFQDFKAFSSGDSHLADNYHPAGFI
jgi:hypothetical protein